MKQLAKGLAALVLLTACSSPIATSHSGRVRLAVLWPGIFSVQTLPSGTRSLSVRVSGSGLAQALETTLIRNDQTSQSLELELPIGSKTVAVKALNQQNEVLAEDQQEVTIQASQLTRLEMNLREMPRPTPSPPGTSSTGEPGQAQSGQGESSPSPAGQQQPSSSPSTEPQPVVSASPVVSPNPVSSPDSSASNNTGSSGGSSSGAGTSTVVMNLLADPNPVSGLNFPTALKVNFANATLATDLLAQFGQNKATQTWTCIDSAQNTGCGTFSTGSDPFKKFWTPPLNQAGTFTLSVDISDQNNVHYQSSVTVSVIQGVGSITAGAGGFDGGETGGQ